MTHLDLHESPKPPQWPASIESETELDDVLTRPTAGLREFIRSVSSPLLILGAGGKMGPTLAGLARRAADEAGHPLEVITVSRFGDNHASAWLEQRGIKTIRCDLLDVEGLRRLPEAANVVHLVGMKFGTAKNPALTWVMNTVVAARVSERYPGARIVALSTGNVYPLDAVSRGGSIETDSLTPIGEYANAAVGRERVFEFYSQRNQTPTALLRLFYAVELRYGVPVDIGRKLLAGEPIDLTQGYFNCIWQGDANEMILRALDLAQSPPSVWNLHRPEVYSVRSVAIRLGELLEHAPVFSGSESPMALLGNSSRICAKLGEPVVPLDTMLQWIARWLRLGGRTLGRPTHFETRDGKY